jgi:hypothetical protein
MSNKNAMAFLILSQKITKLSGGGDIDYFMKIERVLCGGPSR